MLTLARQDRLKRNLAVPMTYAHAAAFPLPGDILRLRSCLDTPGWLDGCPPNEQVQQDRMIAALDLGALVELAESHGEGAALYRKWLALRPNDPAASGIWYNLGARLNATGDPRTAAQAFSCALRLRPDFWVAALGHGIALEAAGMPEAALSAWRRALPPPDERVRLHNQLARVLEQTGRVSEAAEELRASLLIAPDQPDVQQHLVHNRQRLTRWPPLALDVPGVDEATVLLHCGPLACLALTDDPHVQTHVAKDWVLRKMPSPGETLAPSAPYPHLRLRIGYLSSDFCRHAMAFLITEVLEYHDRNRFEIYGYCASPEDGSAEQMRLRAAMDRFVRVGHLADAELARQIRADEIDILIDLNGLTRGTRVAALRWRPAPLQLTYLGYIGPVPLPELDGFLCDTVTVPNGDEAAYLPPPVRIEGCFQANDGRPPILAQTDRTSEGLPEQGFVFTSMTHHYKITAEVFGDWCAIVAAVPGSVLWLAQDTSEGQDSLHRRWQDAGLDPARLIFATRAAPSHYRARLALADLLLDTFPYNTGTVASDALRMGLPIVTRAGRSFASRMAASLLTAVGQQECIAVTRMDYVQMAVRIAQDADVHARLRAQLQGGAWHRTLGDGRTFTRRLEATLVAAHQRRTAGPAPT